MLNTDIDLQVAALAYETRQTARSAETPKAGTAYRRFGVKKSNAAQRSSQPYARNHDYFDFP